MWNITLIFYLISQLYAFFPNLLYRLLHLMYGSLKVMNGFSQCAIRTFFIWCTIHPRLPIIVSCTIQSHITWQKLCMFQCVKIIIILVILQTILGQITMFNVLCYTYLTHNISNRLHNFNYHIPSMILAASISSGGRTDRI